MTEQIVEWVLAILPSLIAVLTMVGVIVKTIKSFTDLKKEVADMKALEEVKTQLKEVLKENRELKRTINETLTEITRVQRK